MKLDPAALRKALFVVAALGVLTLIANAAWTAHQKRTEKAVIAALLSRSSAALGMVLKEASPDGARAVAAAAEAFAAGRYPRQRELARAADDYLAAARAAAQRRVESTALAARAQAVRAELAEHVRLARQRDAGWIRRGAALRHEAELLHNELERSLLALADNLEALPEAEKILAAHIGEAGLVPAATRVAAAEGARRQAREAQAALDRTARLPAR